MAYTTARTWVDGELVTAALLNTHVRDNLSYLKAAPAFDTEATFGTTADGITAQTVASLANLGTASLTPPGRTATQSSVLFLRQNTFHSFAIFTIGGPSTTVREISDVEGHYSVTSGTGSSANVYWSVGNARFEIENRMGGTRTFHCIYLLTGTD